MLWLLGNSGIHESANANSVGILRTHTTENVNQIFNVGKGIDQLVHDSGKRVLQRVVVDRGEVKIHRNLAKLIVVKFLQHALLDVLEVFLCVVCIQL